MTGRIIGVVITGAIGILITVLGWLLCSGDRDVDHSGVKIQSLKETGICQ